MAPPEKGPGGSSGMAGHADPQSVFHCIFGGRRFQNCSHFSYTLLGFFTPRSLPVISSPLPPASPSPPAPLPHHPLLRHLLLPVSTASSLPSARCSCNSSRLCPPLSDIFPCALGPGICPHPQLSRCLCWRLQTCVSSPGLSLGRSVCVLWVSQGLPLTPRPSRLPTC